MKVRDRRRWRRISQWARRLSNEWPEHLLYEAGMLCEVTGKLTNRHHEDPVVQNALLGD